MSSHSSEWDSREGSISGSSAGSAALTRLPSLRDLHPQVNWAQLDANPQTPTAGTHPTSPHSGAPSLSEQEQIFIPPAVEMEDDASSSSYQNLRKRNRSSYSCTECKRRKIRCDRKIPCEPCKKRRESYNCRMSSGNTSPLDGYVSRRDFMDLESRYLDLDYRFSELENVLHLLLEAISTGELPSPAENIAMRNRISSITQSRGHPTLRTDSRSATV